MKKSRRIICHTLELYFVIVYRCVVKNNNDIIYSVLPSISTHCYVKFNGTYNFENLPDLFEYEGAETSYNEYLKNLNKPKEVKPEPVIESESSSSSESEPKVYDSNKITFKRCRFYYIKQSYR